MILLLSYQFRLDMAVRIEMQQEHIWIGRIGKLQRDNSLLANKLPIIDVLIRLQIVITG
ncbi:hypothetical protein [Xanthomonas massiliensis]|uniref:hypothetical protein n=1 Tax=Xanthomonas massiliensis TaxID=1720302 RepID=UPI00136648B4|nr:hypothetical protein [Xanthomonas massiliensis]